MKITFAFIALFFTANAFSQSWQLPYINYTIKDGLPSNEVYDVIQDSFGYMWFSTDNGLSRFDGYKFKNYGKEKGLTDRVIFDLQLDKHGRIWMNGLNGKLYYYSPSFDSIFCDVKYNLKENLLHGLSTSYYYDNSKEALIMLYNLNNNTQEYYEIYENKTIKKIFKSRSGALVNGDLLKSVISEDGKKLIFSNIRDEVIEWYDKDDFEINLPKKYLEFDKNLIIVHSRGSHLFEYKNKNFKLDLPFIQDILINEDSTLFVCFIDDRGVKKYKNIAEFKSNNYKYLIENISATKIRKDNCNSFWITSLNDGIFRINHNRQIQIMNIPTKEVKKLVKDKNWIYAFMSNSKIYKFKSKLGQFEDSNLIFNLKKSFFNNNKNYLIDNLDCIYSFKNNKFEKFPIDNSKNRNFSGTSVADADSFLLTTNSFGLIKYNIKDKSILKIVKERCNTIKIIDKDKILVGGIGGLFQFKDNKLLPIKRDLNNYLNSRIDYINKLADSTIILGSKNDGLYFLRDSCVDFYDVVNEFNVDLIKFIEVNGNDIWVVTSKSIIVLKYIKEEIVDKAIFKLGLDLPQDQIHTLIFDNDKVFIGMEKNIVSMDNSEVFRKVRFVPKPFIERLMIRNQSRKFKDIITLEYFENNISIRLLAINYMLQGAIDYRYAINNGAYQDIVDSRDINLIELSHGKYELKFIAKNESGIWSEPTLFTLIILPPWWQTWWFYTLMGLTISFFTYLIMRRRLQMQKKDALLKEEIRSLEKSALQAQMNPHFIFNSLNSIQKYILINNKEEASEYLSKFASLIRLNLKSSNSDVVALSEEILLLGLYLDLEKLRFKNKFSYDFTIEVEENRIQKIRIPPMLLQPIIENAILHGIAGISEKGKINILIKDVVLENYLSVIITDNGKGISNVQNSINHQSLGSKITKKRLELISNSENNNFNLIDLLDNEGNVIGAKAEIFVTYKMEESE